MKKSLQTRRAFLKASAHTALLGSGAMAVNGKMNLMGAALAAQSQYSNLNDYKALVCIFLYGGSDSFNLFIPADSAQFKSYQQSRGRLALAEDTLLDETTGQVKFNEHLTGLQALYSSGDLAIVRNVGNLIQPVSREQYQKNPELIPAELFAHNHQQEQVQKSWSSQPTGLVGSGWGGRMADLLLDANASKTLPPCFSVNNANFFQTGNRTSPISINAVRGPQLMSYLDVESSSSNTARNATMNKILQLQTTHAMEQFQADAFVSARESSRALSSVIDASPDLGPVVSKNKLADQLRMIAKLISGREQLGMKRQIFFAGLGGWDTHDNQTPRLDLLTQQLNSALVQFDQDMSTLGVRDDVTAFTTSDFGRTLTINGDGSDHGWGGHYLVMGGAVNGGRLYGDWPNYAVGSEDDIGNEGRVIPSLSLNEYGAALGGWMGLSNSDLLDVFPDLANFNDDWRSGLGLFS